MRDPGSSAPRRPAPRPNNHRRIEDHDYHSYGSDESTIVRRSPPRSFPSAPSSRYEEPPPYEEDDNVYYDSSGRLYEPSPPPNPAPRPKEQREGLQGLIEIVNKIQEVFAIVGNNVLDMPQIAVVGGQSSGKSSVLENIVGKDFLPRGSGIVTRRPLILQLIYDDSVRDDYGVFLHKPGRQYYDFDEIRDEIEADTIRETGTGICVSERPIILKVYSANVINLTLIDLPGITRVPVGDQPKDIEVIIRRMVLKFIRQPNCIIMAVTAANTDLANSDAIQMAREVDPDGLRTVGVITKLDLMDRGTDAYDILSNKLIPLRLGYVGVINRGQKDIDTRKSMQLQWQDEDAFLRRHYASIADVNGTRYLREKLNTLLLQHIKLCLPTIITKVNEFKAEKVKELEVMSVGLSTLPQMQIAFFDNVNQFVNRFQQLVDGNGSDTINEVVGGGRIRYIFHNVFREKMEALEYVSEIPEEDILKDIANQQGVSGGLFTPDQSFINLTKKGILTFYPYCEDCTRLVEEELCTDLQLIDLPIFTTCPLFKQRLLSVIQSIIHSQTQKTIELIRQLIGMELTLINVYHPDFNGTHIEKVRVEATALVRKRLQAKKAKQTPTYTLPVVENWLEKRNKFHQYQRRFAQIQNRILTYAHNTSLSDPASEPHSFSLEGASAQMIDANQAAGEYVFEVRADARVLQFRTNQQQVAENWVKWVAACSSEKRYQDTLRQLMTIDEGDEDAESILQDPVALEKKISVEIVKMILSSYYDIIRKKLIDEIPKAIVYMLVNKVEELITPTVVQELFSDQSVVEMLAEDPSITKKREETQKAIEYLDEAIEKINFMQASGDLGQSE